MAETATVTITIEGVRQEHLPRLRTMVKTHLVKFGRKLTVAGDEDGTGEKVPKRAKPWKRGTKTRAV